MSKESKRYIILRGLPTLEFAPTDTSRALNNISNNWQVMYALTKIKGVGRRYSNLVCKKADVDLNKRYGLIFLGMQSVD